MIKRFTDAECFEMFAVDVDVLIAATNDQVGEANYLDPADYVGVELWEVKRPKGPRGSVIDTDTLSREDMMRLQRIERKERVAALVNMDIDFNALEAENKTVTDLLDAPLHMGV